MQEKTLARDPDPPIHLAGRKARGGEIVLRTRRQRSIFLGGLIGVGLFALLLGVAGCA
ncbi:peptide ABC transporter permease [Sphingomonas sp. CL5.1]|uniref:peptide ABC transporter permease n=1 Tax=Sphingomonas sp. CL5.1 TaxID=2653203 RepID=UPI0020C735E4|nr:peptide ABC transporter permease [Sphingomonas sp. CL5.1]